MSPAAPRTAAAPGDAAFDRLDRLAPAALARWWAGRLRRVLEIAYAELPFYRERFDAAGFVPSTLRSLDDLWRVPSFDKAELLARGDAGLERRAGGAGTVLAASSGTEGTTFVALPRRWRAEQGRSSLRAHWWAGLRPGTPFVLSAPAWHTYASVQTWIAERLGLPCAVVAGTWLPRFAGRIVDALRTFRPRFASLFLPMVFSLVAEARRRGLAPRDVFASLDTLVVTGAPITPGMRAHVEQVTGAGRVVELAGTSENLLAVECAARAGLHVVPDTCVVQVADLAGDGPAAPGARGRVVSTALVPWGSLYLRYESGDLGTLDTSPCRCGLPSPRVKLLGRAADALRLAGGSAILPYDVQLAIEEAMPELAGAPFAILREEAAAGRLAVVLGPPLEGDALAPGACAELERRLAARFGARVSVQPGSSLPLRFKGVPALVTRQELS